MPYKDSETNRTYQRLWKRDKRANDPQNNGGQIGELEKRLEAVKIEYDELRGPPRYYGFESLEARSKWSEIKTLEKKLKDSEERAEALEVNIEKWSDGGILREQQKFNFAEGRNTAMGLSVSPDPQQRQIGAAQLSHYDIEERKTANVRQKMIDELIQLRGK